jgi:SAM-dependent methyltransferase
MLDETEYDSWHDAHAEDDDTSTPWYNFVKKSIRKNDMDGCRVLEIGCGRGGFSKFLIENYPAISKLYACDFSDSALAIAKGRVTNQANVIWQKEDIQSLSFPDNSFETIISCETIEHIPDPHQALKELYRVLKPGGRLLLTCPNYFNLFGLWVLYRKIIGKPYTEGGQPYVNYIQIPAIYGRIRLLGFKLAHFHSTEFVIPAWVPKTLYSFGTPPLLKWFGNRTFYILIKTI